MRLPGMYPLHADAPELAMSREILQTGYKTSVNESHLSERAELRNTLRSSLWTAEEQDLAIKEQLKALQRAQAAQRVIDLESTTAVLETSRTLADPPRSTLSQEDWIKKLSGRMPLTHLERQLPEVWTMETLLDSLASHDVPLLRASWLIKFIYCVSCTPRNSVFKAGDPLAQNFSTRWTLLCWEYIEQTLPGLMPSDIAVKLKDGVDSEPPMLLFRRLLIGVNSIASRTFLYVVRLIGQTVREGLISSHILFNNICKQLQGAWKVQKLALMPLLELILKDVWLCQTNVKTFVQLCTQQLAGETLHQAEKLYRAALLSMLQTAMQKVPHIFISMGTIEGFSSTDPTSVQTGDRCRLREVLGAANDVHVESTSSPDRKTCESILQCRDQLFASVQAQALGCNDFEMVQVLDKALSGGDPEEIVKELLRRIGPWTHKNKYQVAVDLICNWAVWCQADFLRRNLQHEGKTGRARLQAVRHLSGCCLLSALRKILRESCARVRETSLQGYLFDWLERKSLSEVTGRIAGHAPLAFLLQVIMTGNFCPGAYLTRLIAHGVFHETPRPSVGSTGHANVAQKKAELHLAILRQIDPDLPIPSLQEDFQPATPDPSSGRAASETGGSAAGRAWTTDLHLFVATRQRILDQYQDASLERPFKRAKTEGPGYRSTPPQQPFTSRRTSPALRKSPGVLRPVEGRGSWPSSPMIPQPASPQPALQPPGGLTVAQPSLDIMLPAVSRAEISVSRSPSQSFPEPLRTITSLPNLVARPGSVRAFSESPKAGPRESSPATDVNNSGFGSLSSERSLGTKTSHMGLEALQRLAQNKLLKQQDINIEACLLALEKLRLAEKVMFVTWLSKLAGSQSVKLLRNAVEQPLNLVVLITMLETAEGHEAAITILLKLISQSCETESSSALWTLCAMLKRRIGMALATQMLKQIVTLCLQCLEASQLAGKSTAISPVLQLLCHLILAYRNLPVMEEFVSSLRSDASNKIVADAIFSCTQLMSKQGLAGLGFESAIAPEISAAGTPACKDLFQAMANDTATVKFIAAWQSKHRDIIVPEDRVEILRTAVQHVASLAIVSDAQGHCLYSLYVWAQEGLTHQARASLSLQIAQDCLKKPHSKGAGLPLLKKLIALGVIDMQHALEALSAARSRTATALTLLMSSQPHALDEPPNGPFSMSIVVEAEIATCLSEASPSIIWNDLFPNTQGATSWSEASKTVQQACQSASLVSALLADPQWLLTKLRSLNIPSESAHPQLPHWFLLMTLLDHTQELDKHISLQMHASKLLNLLTAANSALISAALRALLDEQIFQACMEKTGSLEKATQKAMNAVENAKLGSTAISEEEKTFTSQVLAQLLIRPEQAGLLARLTKSLGHGLHEYLLLQIDWVLQDTDTLTGHHSLAAVLQRRFGSLLDQNSQGQARCDRLSEGCLLERAFANIALACLGSSQPVQQRSMADQLLAQLQKLANILKQHPTPLSPVRMPRQETALTGVQVPDSKDASSDPSFGAARARRLTMHQKASPGSVDGVRMAIWLRIIIIPSFLPLIYADRETDQASSLRSRAAKALLDLLVSETVYKECSGLDMDGQAPAESPLAAALKAIEGIEGGLFEKLLQLLQALVSDKWSSWIRGAKDGLREVQALPTEGLEADLESLTLPVQVRRKILSALNSPPGAKTVAILKANLESGDSLSSPWSLPNPARQLSQRSGLQEHVYSVVQQNTM